MKKNKIMKPFLKNNIYGSQCMYKMESYCLKCRKNTKNIDPEVSSNKNNRTMILSKCAICGSKKSRFIKKQEAKELLSQLGNRTPLSKVPILGDILF